MTNPKPSQEDGDALSGAPLCRHGNDSYDCAVRCACCGCSCGDHRTDDDTECNECSCGAWRETTMTNPKPTSQQGTSEGGE